VIRWIAAFVLVAAPAGAAELTVLTAGALSLSPPRWRRLSRPEPAIP
jgi:hypothetical protein